MPDFAVIDSENKVVNIIVAEDVDTAMFVTKKTCVEYTIDNPAYIGGTYDSNTGAFLAPEV